MSELPKDARFLIVDDEPANVAVLEMMLDQWGCERIAATTDSREAASLYASFRPDVVLLDLMMPHLDGFEVLANLKPLVPADDYLLVLVLTADLTMETRRRALDAGAKDFLTKPFDRLELFLRLRNALEIRALHLELRAQNEVLDQKVRARTEKLELAQLELLKQAHDLENAQIEILARLSRAAEWRDDETGQHTQRVGQVSAHLARAMGLSAEDVTTIQRTAALHDVGKIGIPDHILLKPGRLTDAEFATMRTHTTLGSGLLANGHSRIVRIAESIALTHHERWDGSGYPRGLSGESIPIEGRIVAVADVFDALVHHRPYKRAWPVRDAINEIRRGSGHHFDPAVVEAFCAEMDAILHIQGDLSDADTIPLPGIESAHGRLLIAAGMTGL